MTDNKEIERLAKEAGLEPIWKLGGWAAYIEAFAALVAEDVAQMLEARKREFDCTECAVTDEMPNLIRSKFPMPKG